MKKIYQPMKNFSKIFKSELSIQFTIGKLLVMLFSVLLPVLVIIFQDDISEIIEKGWTTLEPEKKLLYNKAEYIRKFKLLRSNLILTGPMLSQGITYAILLRVSVLFMDKNTLDKNRLSYLKYSKHLVSFSKIFVDLILFILHIAILMGVGVSIIKFKLNGEFETETYLNLIKIAIGLVFFYLFSGYGVKFLNSLLEGNWFKWPIIGFWLLLTIIYFLLFSPLMQIDEIKEFYINNIDWIIYIPFMNLLTPTLFLRGIENIQGEELINMNSMIPMIVTSIVFVLSTWYWFAIKQKEFLCT